MSLRLCRPARRTAMHRNRLGAGLAALVLAVAAPAGMAAAQEDTLSRPGITMTLGLGAAFTPDYPGADSNSLGPTGSFGLQELLLPGGFGIGGPSARPLEPGFGPRGAFRYLSPRRPGDAPELAGTDRIGRAVELGVGLAHVTEFGRAFAEIRRGFGGHEGWVADVGVDAIWRVNPGLKLTAGPRAQWGDGRFTRTYFGVPAGAALPAFDATGGIVSVGAEIGMVQDFGNGWGLQGSLTWDRLRGDAARSPITRAGSRDQFGARLVVTRSFTLGG